MFPASGKPGSSWRAKDGCDAGQSETRGTGLDLVMFSDLIFYEVTTSLYTLWQAMRRVWRLGQNKEVNVTFLSYADTMECEILRRMDRR